MVTATCTADFFSFFLFFFVLMNTVCPALICLLVLCKVVKSNRSILKSTRNSILSMKVKHLV